MASTICAPVAAKLLDLQALDGGQRADGHEGRHFHRPVRSDERRSARGGCGVGVVELEGKHSYCATKYRATDVALNAMCKIKEGAMRWVRW